MPHRPIRSGISSGRYRNGSIKLWRDGFLIHSKAIIPNRTDYKPRFLALGGAQANTDFSNSEIAEVLYNRKLKDDERIDLEDHLRLKWMRLVRADFPIIVRLSNGHHPDFDYLNFAEPEQGGDLVSSIKWRTSALRGRRVERYTRRIHNLGTSKESWPRLCLPCLLGQ